MLEHRSVPAGDPVRVVVLGAGGFVGNATAELLRERGIRTETLARTDVDLLASGASDALAGRLRADDSLVVISANAPCKDATMLRENVAMMETVCAALAKQPLAHVVYISSDAVYGDEPVPLTEASPAAPGSIHGVMHLARELMLRDAVDGPFAVLRPTLIYGAGDPHNGYGPNRFRRLAADGNDIDLFGEGEEQRDHVLIDDVAEIIVRTLRHRSDGILNVATGDVASFREIADTVVTLSGAGIAIRNNPRVGPMPHNGYRPFDPAATLTAFPDFAYTPLTEGLARTHKAVLDKENG